MMVGCAGEFASLLCEPRSRAWSSASTRVAHKTHFGCHFFLPPKDNPDASCGTMKYICMYLFLVERYNSHPPPSSYLPFGTTKADERPVFWSIVLRPGGV